MLFSSSNTKPVKFSQVSICKILKHKYRIILSAAILTVIASDNCTMSTQNMSDFAPQPPFDCPYYR